jgi:hypothetical protein
LWHSALGNSGDSDLKKPEAKKYIHSLCYDWRTECGLQETPMHELDFADFYDWLQQNHPQVLKFRSTMGAKHDVEMWFDRIFHQTWRN